MKLFLLVYGFQDCLKIQSELTKLAEWCEANALDTVRFSYMLGSVILDRVDSISDLGIIMDSRMSFAENVDD
jgi:hypothetical protein